MSADGRCAYSINPADLGLNLRRQYQWVYERSPPQFRCHRETAPDSEHCLFHQCASERDDVDVQQVFRSHLNGASPAVQGVAPAASFQPRTHQERLHRRLNFIGAKLGDLDFAFETLSIDSAVSLDLRLAELGHLNLERARVRTGLDLRHAELDVLDLTDAEVDGRVEVAHSRPDQLEFRMATIDGDVTLEALATDGKIGMQQTRIGGDVRLSAVDVGGHLSLSIVDIRGEATLRDVSVKSNVDATDGTFHGGLTVAGRSAVGGFFSLLASTVGDDLKLGGDDPDNRLTAGELILDEATLEGRVSLSGAWVEETLSFVETSVAAQSSLTDTRAETLVVRGSCWCAPVSLSAVTTEQTLDARGATFEDWVTVSGLRFSADGSDGEPPHTESVLMDFSGADFEDGLELEFDRIGDLPTEYLVDFEGGQVHGGTLPQSVDGVRLYYNFTDATLGAVELASDETPKRSFDQYLIYRTTFDGFDFTAQAHRSELRRNWSLHDFPTRFLEAVDSDMTTDVAGAGPNTLRGALPGLDSDGPRYSLTTVNALETTYLRARRGADEIGDTMAASEFFLLERSFIKQYHFRTFEQAIRQRLSSLTGLVSPTGSDVPLESGHPGKRWVANLVLERSCGYGERPLRPIRFSCWVMLCYAVVYFTFGAFNQPSAFELFGAGRVVSAETARVAVQQLSFSVQAFVALIFGSAPATNSGVLTRLAAATEGFIGAFTIALFVFTFTRSVYR